MKNSPRWRLSWTSSSHPLRPCRRKQLPTSPRPATHPIPLENVFREDVPVTTLTQEEALSGAPDAQDGKFRVPAILDED